MANLKVPKRIAGVKIPKTIRNGPVRSFLNSYSGQLLVAEAVLVAGAATMPDGTDPDSASGRAVRRRWRQIKNAAQTVEGRSLGDLGQDGDRIRFAFGEAIRAFRERLARTL
jgi:hypothetical protein